MRPRRTKQYKKDYRATALKHKADKAHYVRYFSRSVNRPNIRPTAFYGDWPPEELYEVEPE